MLIPLILTVLGTALGIAAIEGVISWRETRARNRRELRWAIDAENNATRRAHRGHSHAVTRGSQTRSGNVQA